MSVDDGLDGDRTIVGLLLNYESGMTPWEVEFAESIGRRVLDRGRPLLERQRAKANEILARLEDGEEGREEG